MNTQYWTSDNPNGRSMLESMNLINAANTGARSVKWSMDSCKLGWATLRVNERRLAVKKAVSALIGKGFMCTHDTTRLDPAGWQLVRTDLRHHDTVDSTVSALRAQLCNPELEVIDSDNGTFRLMLSGNPRNLRAIREALVALGVMLQPVTGSLLSTRDEDIEPTVILHEDGSVTTQPATDDDDWIISE